MRLPRFVATAVLLLVALVAGACAGSDLAEAPVAIAGSQATEAPVEATPEVGADGDADTDATAPEAEATAEPTAAAEPTIDPSTTVEATSPDEDEDEDEDEVGAGAKQEQLLADLQVEVDTWLATSTAPGVSLAVNLPGGETFELAAGVADVTTLEPVQTDDYFRIASITKPMTAAVVLTLVDEGLIELDEPVATYLGDDWIGDYPLGEQITVAQLMNHTNGFLEFAFDIGFYIEASQRQDRAYEPEEILDFLAKSKPVFAPGTAYQYETGGFVAAGLIIEAVTGRTAAEVMRERIFEPAGADDIYLTPQEFPPQAVVHGYARAELYLALSALIPESDVGLTVGADDPVVDVLSGDQRVLQSAGWTGGGNEAQLSSVAAIFKSMFNGAILSDDAIQAMTTTVFESNYGLGLDVTEVGGEVVYRHGGGVPGFRSQAGYLPDHDISYAFSANLIPLPDGAGVSRLAEAIVPLLIAYSAP